MELVHRARFTDMLRTLTDVTTEKLVYGKKTNPCIFDGYITEYRNKDDRLLAQVLHTDNGPLYYIDFEWEQNHPIDNNMFPPDQSVIELGMDSRGWYFTAIRNRNDYPESHCIRILAGCRNFSIEQAKEHWKSNPEVYPRILMAEQIAIHRGWIPKQDARSKIEEILKNMPMEELIQYGKELGIDIKPLIPFSIKAMGDLIAVKCDPQVDAGELACEKTPTIVVEGDIRELELRVHDSLLK